MSRGQEFFGCSQDVFHRNQSDENELCSQENWQGAVICLAQVNPNNIFYSNVHLRSMIRPYSHETFRRTIL